MNRRMAASLVFAVLAGVCPPSVKADTDAYFKVEIKGRLQLYNLPGRAFSPQVLVNREGYDLDLEGAKVKLPGEKQLKKLDNEIVIVQGHLIRLPGSPLRIMVTKITSGKPAVLASR